MDLVLQDILDQFLCDGEQNALYCPEQLSDCWAHYSEYRRRHDAQFHPVLDIGPFLVLLLVCVHRHNLGHQRDGVLDQHEPIHSRVM